ncbi:hypothetical protein IAR55_001068 [Kwoniella newhampshirensis]|uniref:Argonaute n=1 Tax=Kwoniella newhampshirensis TaxID=1651941 RepID=A0AAW0Z4S5_9TREE
MSRYDGIDDREYARGRRTYDEDDGYYARSSATSTAPAQLSQASRYDDYTRSQDGSSIQGERYVPSRAIYNERDPPARVEFSARDYPAAREAYRPHPIPPRSEASTARDPPSRYGIETSAPREPSSTAVRSAIRNHPPPSLASDWRDLNKDKPSDVTETLEKLSLTSFYVRPGYGEKGKHLTVLANFFQVRAKDGKAKVIYHYDVDMEPQVAKGANAKKPKGLLRAVWEQLCQEQKGEWLDGFAASAYDGRKNVFTPNQPIPNWKSQSFLTAVAPDGVVARAGHTTSSDDEYRRWKVTLKLVAIVDLQYVMNFCEADKGAPSNEEKCLTGLMATNVLMRDLPSKKYAQVGATGNKFFSLAGAVAIPQGAVVCKGFMQSFRYSSSGLPLLNLDIGFSAFLATGPALEVIGKILTRGGPPRGRGGFGGHPGGNREIDVLGEYDINIVKKILRGAKFTVMHRSSTRLHTILSITRECAQNIKFSIEGRDGQPDQTISICDYYQQFHQSPVTKPRLPCVQYGKKAFVPLEFVRLADWNSLPPTRLTAEQTAELIKVSAVRPKERALAVNNWRAELAYEKQAKIAAWGLQVNTSMIQVRARILPPPRIVYAKGNEVRALDGGWNLRGKQFFRNGKKPLVAWSCAPQLICCVLPGRDAWLYEQIKKSSFTDLKGPVPTQCMQAAKIRTPRGIDAYTGNLVMKIQSKLGGLTHQVPISELPGMQKGKTMLLGGDLGLPPVRSGDDSAPTVACTIATYSRDCDAYSAQIRLQEGRGEIIVEFSSMVEEHLKIFKKNNDEYPDRILIFRDGISEGQYAAALLYEHNAVLKACAKLEKGYRPRILLCICAKRHTTRFFGRDSDVDRSGNLPSGLVVDQSVTHPYAFDFFLQAHAGRVGTARPTHYICLLDELAISPDQLQQLVHSLCYTFARCTRSVSLVPVCYIADLVCQKARIIVHEPGTSVAPSESSAGRSGFASSRRTGFNIDIMQVQKVLQRNEDLSEVAWWM